MQKRSASKQRTLKRSRNISFHSSKVLIFNIDLATRSNLFVLLMCGHIHCKLGVSLVYRIIGYCIIKFLLEFARQCQGAGILL